MNQPIASLNLPLFVINKLEKNGYYHCNDLKQNFEELKEKINIPDWFSFAEAPSTKTALELYEEESKWKPPVTYIPVLDALLKSEIAPGLITELTGFPGSGKTQISLHLSVGVEKRETFFISTNNNFSIDRLREIAQKHVCDVESVLKQIFCLEITKPDELLASVYFLETWLNDHGNICLLLIDSLSWSLRQKHYNERPNLIYTFLQHVRLLSKKYQFGVIVTNDLTTRITGSNIYNTSSFGGSFYHAINNRILLSKENGSFKAKILKSVISDNHEVTFKLFHIGVLYCLMSFHNHCTHADKSIS